MTAVALVVLFIFLYIVEELPAKRREEEEYFMSDYEKDRDLFK